jgi:hypothetical protein
MSVLTVTLFALGFLLGRAMTWLTNAASYHRQERWPAYNPEGPR